MRLHVKSMCLQQQLLLRAIVVIIFDVDTGKGLKLLQGAKSSQGHFFFPSCHLLSPFPSKTPISLCWSPSTVLDVLSASTLVSYSPLATQA